MSSSAIVALITSGYIVANEQVQDVRDRRATATATMMTSDSEGDGVRRDGDGASTWVSALHRFAVKGLDRDELDHVDLYSGGAFPNDRRWALKWSDSADRFFPFAPEWLHKSSFLCAFSATELMASFVTTFEDDTCKLIIQRRGFASGDGRVALLRESLDDPSGRDRLASFFSNASGRTVTVVSGQGSGSAQQKHHHHQFGNTASGVKAGDGSTRTIHILNTNTVAALSAKANTPLHVDRFRANVVLEGSLPAWEEFQWVGRTIQLGGATLKVIKRAVRCEGINVDARHGSGRADMDVPALLAKHFPEHGAFLGVYAQVVTGGAVRIGDRIAVAGA